MNIASRVAENPTLRNRELSLIFREKNILSLKPSVHVLV